MVGLLIGVIIAALIIYAFRQYIIVGLANEAAYALDKCCYPSPDNCKKTVDCSSLPAKWLIDQYKFDSFAYQYWLAGGT